MKLIEIANFFYWFKAYRFDNKDDDDVHVRIYDDQDRDNPECAFTIYTVDNADIYVKDERLTDLEAVRLKTYCRKLIEGKQGYFIAKLYYKDKNLGHDDCYSVLEDENKTIYDIHPSEPKLYEITVFLPKTDLHNPQNLLKQVKMLYEDIFATKADFDFMEEFPDIEDVAEDYKRSIDSSVGGFTSWDYLRGKLLD